MINRIAHRLLRLRNRHIFGLDLLMLGLTPAVALALRTDGAAIARHARSLALFTLAALACKALVFLRQGLYARYWRYASVDELALISRAVFYALLLDILVFFGLLRPSGLLAPGFPRSIPLLDGILTLLAVGGLRFSVRAADIWLRQEQPGGPARRVLIVGAGHAGSLLVKEIKANPRSGLAPVGFVDDDPAKQGVLIHCLPVLGDRHSIPHLAKKHQVDEIIIAMPAAPGKTIREIVTISKKAGLPARIIPGLYELLNGAVSVKQLRKVQIEDLLRREPVRVNFEQVAALLRGRRVLVTGAGGSIGSELCRQITRCAPAGLVLLGHGENSIFEIYHELQATPHASPVAYHPVIADIRFPDRLRAVFEQHRPEIVFHAAAHKHVPLMEDNFADAITNNILGTQCVVETSLAAGVTHLVLISTDKAVNPTSVMGVTKRVAELIVQQAACQTGCCYVTVRFGNVLGSRGSVVPFFQKQIAAGGPVTVAHPDVRRYFMTIPEAVQLVLQAAALGQCGEVFVLDMGKPVRIYDLACDLIRLSGLEPGRDMDIVFTGLRPGDKMFEELFLEDEKYTRAQHAKILVSRDGAGPSNGQSFQYPSLDAAIQAIIAAARQGNIEDARSRLQKLVPEYRLVLPQKPVASVLQTPPSSRIPLYPESPSRPGYLLH